MSQTKADEARAKVEEPKIDQEDFGSSELEIVRAKNLATQFLNPTVWGQIVGLSSTFIQSGALPAHYKNKAQVAMAIQAGYEMGMKPIESLNSLYPVNGTFNIWGKAVVKRLRLHGFRVSYKDESDNSCTAIVTKINDSDEHYEETYTFEMAEKSGYVHGTSQSGSKYIKVGWKEGMNRKRKLRYGALSMIIHTYIPDVLDSASEIQEVFEDSYVEIKKEQERENTQEAEIVTERVENVSDLDNFIKSNKDVEKKVEEIKSKKSDKKAEKKDTVDNVDNQRHNEDSEQVVEKK